MRWLCLLLGHRKFLYWQVGVSVNLYCARCGRRLKTRFEKENPCDY